MKQELWSSGKDVSMAKILDARENRVQIQQEMLQKSRPCEGFSVHKMDL